MRWFDVLDLLQNLKKRWIMNGVNVYTKQDGTCIDSTYAL